MTSYTDFLWLDQNDVLRLMQECTEEPDRELAHQKADELICCAVFLAVAGELDERYAHDIVQMYQEVDRWFG